MIVGEGRGTTLEGEIKDYVSGVSSHITPHKRYSGIISGLRMVKITNYTLNSILQFKVINGFVSNWNREITTFRVNEKTKG